MKSVIAMAIGSAALTLAACSTGGSSGSAGTPPTSAAVTSSAATTEAAYDGPTIPAGSYTKEITRKDLRRLGIRVGTGPDEFDPVQFSAAGTALVVYKFAQDEWTQFSGPDAGHLLPASNGTHTYDADGNLVVSEPCCGDSTLTWNWDGTTLTMTLKSWDMPPVPMDHLMRDGTYTKTG